jgi:hypothetical protein
MALRFLRRVFLLAALLMIMGGLAGGLALAGVSGGARPAGGLTGVAPAATASGQPVTPPPTTAPPTTVAPPTTSAPAPPPTTSAPAPPPTTSAPAPPPTSASPSPSPSPSISGSPTASSSSFNLVYLWIALAVIAVIVLIAVIGSVTRGRAARRRAWQARATDAYTRGSGLFQSVQAATQASQYRDPNTGARWADVQARAEDLTRTLQSLRGSAPGEYERARADDALNALDALRSATQASDPSAAGRLQARLRDFEDAMQALREQQ